MSLVSELRKERVKLKLSLLAVSEKIGYHYNSIQQWETNKISPSVQSIVDYADALGFDVVLKRKEK